jgi:tetratricopeptide (TPR) repeat protein
MWRGIRMSRIAKIIIALAVLVIGLSAGVLVIFVARTLDPSRDRPIAWKPIDGTPAPTKRVADTTGRTLAVFNFKGTGGDEADLYAIGFARALSDRLFCAPTMVTQQLSVNYIYAALHRKDPHLYEAPTADAALQAGKRLGVKHIITGELIRSGEIARVVIRVVRTSDGKSAGEVTLSGSLSELPALQTQAASRLIKILGVEPTTEQLAELAKPDFARPETLTLYGRSVIAKDDKERKRLRWEALDADPTSSFAALRLLEYSYFNMESSKDVAGDERLAELLQSVDTRFPGNSHIAVFKALLLAGQFHYKQAEEHLSRLVVRDPNCYLGHYAMAKVAAWRANGRLSIEETRLLVQLWPSNPWSHIEYAHLLGDFRHGTSRKQLQEALAATKLDPDIASAWYEVMDAAARLNKDRTRDRAFQEIVRIDPKDMWAYNEYARYFTRYWDNSPAKIREITSLADKALGKDSLDVTLIRAYAVQNNGAYGETGPRRPKNEKDELNRLLKIALAKAPESEDVQLLAWQVSLVNQDREKVYEIAKRGFEKWGGEDWYRSLGRSCAFRYEDHQDRAALEDARKLFARYIEEIPYSSYGWTQLGWCLSHQGHRPEAKRAILRALEIDPDNRLAKEKLKYVQ